MTITRIKPNANEQHLTHTVKAPIWKNMYFDKHGRSGLGMDTYDSQELAKEAAEMYLKGIPEYLRKYASYTLSGGVIILARDYSHNIQIPWK